MNEPMDQGPPEGGAEPHPSGSGGSNPAKGKTPLAKSKVGSGRVKDGAVAFWGLGDSHLRRKHGFPDAYELARANEEMDRRLSALNRKEVWERDGKGYDQGFRLSRAYYGQILDLIDEQRGKAVAYFISVGTNDLRQEAATEKEKGERMDEILLRYRGLMTKVMETPGAALLVLEPVPCATGIQSYRDQLHQRLKAECEKHEKVKYVGLTGEESPLVRGSDGSYHSPDYWWDEVHLNRKEGAGLIVKALARTVSKLKDDIFLADPQARDQNPSSPTRRTQRPRVQAPEGVRGTRGGKVEKAPKKLGMGRTLAPRPSAFDRLDSFGRRGRGKPSNGKGAGTSGATRTRSGPGLDYYQRRRQAALKLCQDTMAMIDAAERNGEWLDEDEAGDREEDEDEVVELPPPPTCRPYLGRPPRRGGPRGGRGGRGGGGWGADTYVLVPSKMVFPR
jgi:hypothetical protein